MCTLFRFCLVMFLTAPLFAAPQTVFVLDASGRPLAAASVFLNHADGRIEEVTTDAVGRVAVEAPEQTLITVAADGFEPSQPLSLAGDSLRVVLHPSAYSEEVVVTGARSRVPLTEVSTSVSVIEKEKLDTLLRSSRNLADALGKAVPGLAPGTGSASIWGQTMRGRGMQVLVDGVPLTTLRNTARDLVAIDTSMVERIEVLRGTTALYGDGATGGLINIVTKRPEMDSFTGETQISGRMSLTNPENSTGGRLAQALSGKAGRFDWRVDAAFDRTGSFYDAEGDRIAPDPYGQGGMAEVEGLSLMGKLGWSPSGDQRLQFAFSSLDSEQQTAWTSDPSVNSLPAFTTKARAMKGLDLDHPQGSENQMLQLSWEDADLFGSRFSILAFSRDYQTVFTPFDGRPYAIYGNKIFQSRLESETLGLRIDLESPLPIRGLTAFWGFDAGTEETAQPVWILDPDVFVESGGRTFRTIDDRPWVPLVDKRNQAGFAQLEWMMNERWLVRGGLRYDTVEANIPSFSTLSGTLIEGGGRSWSDTLFNAGLVHYFTPSTRVWTSFSQGFSLPDIGLVLRSAPAGSSLDTLPFQPQIVDAWEVGSRAEAGRWSGSVAAFYNTSEFGTSTAGFNKPVVRAPERVYGMELTGEVEASEILTLGGNFSWTEGKSDPNRDGVYTWLNGYRIAAPSASLWIDHRTTQRWRNRLHFLYSGDRDRFGGSVVFGERPIESYQVVDLTSSFEFQLGRLDIGIENLLNEKYYVRDAQLLRSGRNDSYSQSPGASLTIGWTFRY